MSQQPKILLTISLSLTLLVFLWAGLNYQTPQNKTSTSGHENLSSANSSVDPSPQIPSASPADAEEAPTPIAVAFQNADPEKQRQKLKSLQKKTRSERRTSSESNLPEFPFLNGQELVDVRAISKKNYTPNLGDLLAEAGGYKIYRAPSQNNDLKNFNGRELPVIQQKKGRSLAVVTGEVLVVFKGTPTDIHSFTRDYPMELMVSLPAAKRAIFYPTTLPINLIELAQSLSLHPEVKKVEITSVHDNLRPQ